MKNLKSLIVLFAVAASISFVACAGEAKTEEAPAATTEAAAPMATDTAAAATPAPAADTAAMSH